MEAVDTRNKLYLIIIQVWLQTCH